MLSVDLKPPPKNFSAIPVSYAIEGDKATLGVYALAHDVRHERPVYRQRGGKYFFYHHHEGDIQQWRVGGQKEDEYWLRVDSKDKFPPTSGYLLQVCIYIKVE